MKEHIAQKPKTYPLVVALMKRSRLPWYWVTALVTAGLLLLLTLAVSLDGTIGDMLGWGFWRYYGDGLLLIAYILMISPFMWRLRIRAIQAFRPLLTIDDDAFDRLAAKASAPNRRWEWVFVLIGAGLAVALGQPWDLPWGPGELWTSVYLVIVGTLMNSLLWWLVYDTLAGTVRIAQLSRQTPKIDILFNTELLIPIARWSLGISLGWVGGISLSLVFQTQESLLRGQTITLYAILIGVTVLAFLLSMWSTRNTIAKVKRRELVLARKHLAAASLELKDRTSHGRLEGMEGLSSTMTSWATYQRLVKDTPTWPFDINIMRRLAASTMAPILVYLLKILSGIGFSL
jgi:hypothetical protein